MKRCRWRYGTAHPERPGAVRELRTASEPSSRRRRLSTTPRVSALTLQQVHTPSIGIVVSGRGAYDTGLRVDADRLESMIASLAGLHGLVVDRDRPILEADLPFHGVRVQAVLPPVVTSPVLAMRKPAAATPTLDELVAVCEEGCRELVVPGANTVRLLASEEAGVSLARLLRCALRMNPDRIVVGEARGAEALDFLRACNTGHRGAMMTLHANSAEDALNRLDDLVQEAGVPSQMGRIRAAVDLVVYMERQAQVHAVAEVLSVKGWQRGSAGDEYNAPLPSNH